MNLKLPLLAGYICHLFCLSSQSRNLSESGIYQYESQIAISGGYSCHLICMNSQSGNLSVLGIYQYESQISISGRVDLPFYLPFDLPLYLQLDPPELSEWESISIRNLSV